MYAFVFANRMVFENDWRWNLKIFGRIWKGHSLNGANYYSFFGPFLVSVRIQCWLELGWLILIQWWDFNGGCFLQKFVFTRVLQSSGNEWHNDYEYSFKPPLMEFFSLDIVRLSQLICNNDDQQQDATKTEQTWIYAILHKTYILAHNLRGVLTSLIDGSRRWN